MANEKDKRKTKGKRDNAHGSQTTKAAPGKTKAQTGKKQGQGVFIPRQTIDRKYGDAGNPPSRTGRVGQYWIGKLLSPKFARLLRGRKAIPENFRYWDPEFLMQEFNLKGWEFGNWTSQEDRFNYVAGAGIGLLDLQEVLGFPRRAMGLRNHLTIAIGARGKSRAVAHFEPGTYAINITRHSKGDDFGVSGGIGAFAHEYGHALDYWFGTYAEAAPDTVSLSGGSSTRYNFPLIGSQGMRAYMERILDALIWENRYEQEKTTYLKRILKYMDDQGITSNYFIRPNELFARYFEQWVMEKMQEKGMSNNFLHKLKYEALFYTDATLFKKVKPHMDNLSREMKAFTIKNL